MAHLSANGTHLNAISKDNAAHLAVVRLANAWANRELIVTPSETKFAWAAACGIESYPAQVFTASHPDLDALQVAATNALGGASWQTGSKAIFSYWTRANSPCKMAAGAPDFTQYAEFAFSRVLHRFKLRHLFLGKAGVTFRAFVRAYCPSLILADSGMLPGFGKVPSHFWNSAISSSHLEVRFYDHEPESTGDAAELGGQWDIHGTANQGLGVNAEVSCQHYDPFDCYSDSAAALHCPELLARAYANGEPPIPFYHDYELTTSSDGCALLKAGLDDIWMDAHMRGIYPMNLPIGSCLTSYIQRVELRLLVTSAAF